MVCVRGAGRPLRSAMRQQEAMPQPNYSMSHNHAPGAVPGDRKSRAYANRSPYTHALHRQPHLRPLSSSQRASQPSGSDSGRSMSSTTTASVGLRSWEGHTAMRGRG